MVMTSRTPLQRVLLKISGESPGRWPMALTQKWLPPWLARWEVIESGVEVCLVIGGNIFRGVSGAAAGWSAPLAITWVFNRYECTCYANALEP